MNRTKRYTLSLILIIALLAISTSVVFAKELGLLTISGPGIKGELTLKDPNDTMKLEQSGFFDQAVLAKPPKNLDMKAGYNITAQLNLDGKWFRLCRWSTMLRMRDSQVMSITLAGSTGKHCKRSMNGISCRAAPITPSEA